MRKWNLSGISLNCLFRGSILPPKLIDNRNGIRVRCLYTRRECSVSISDWCYQCRRKSWQLAWASAHRCEQWQYCSSAGCITKWQKVNTFVFNFRKRGTHAPEFSIKMQANHSLAQINSNDDITYPQMQPCAEIQTDTDSNFCQMIFSASHRVSRLNVECDWNERWTQSQFRSQFARGKLKIVNVCASVKRSSSQVIICQSRFATTLICVSHVRTCVFYCSCFAHTNWLRMNCYSGNPNNSCDIMCIRQEISCKKATNKYKKKKIVCVQRREAVSYT